MDAFSKILEITNDERVAVGLEAKELLHKWLMLGMSRYVCRYGTLGDGHEKLTASQRYAQCYKEIWTRANEIMLQKANALEARADLIDAERDLKAASSESDKLRIEARILKATQRLTTCSVSMEDTLRQLDEFNKVRLELKAEVEAEYPQGLEQAEEENWKAVAAYRARLEVATAQPQNLRHVPLPTLEKAKLGMQLKNAEMLIAQSVENPEKLSGLLPKPISKETN